MITDQVTSELQHILGKIYSKDVEFFLLTLDYHEIEDFSGGMQQKESVPIASRCWEVEGN